MATLKDGDHHNSGESERVSGGFTLAVAYHKATEQVITCFRVCSDRGTLGCAFGGWEGRYLAPSNNFFHVIRISATSLWLVTVTKSAGKYRAAERYNDFVPSAIFAKQYKRQSSLFFLCHAYKNKNKKTKNKKKTSQRACQLFLLANSLRSGHF